MAGPPGNPLSVDQEERRLLAFDLDVGRHDVRVHDYAAAAAIARAAAIQIDPCDLLAAAFAAPLMASLQLMCAGERL